MLSNHIKSQIKNYALQEIPNECCGVLISKNEELSVFPCRNSAENKKDNFILDYRDYYKASLNGEIKYLYHSQNSLFPSDLDKQSCKGHNIPSIIYSYKEDLFTYLDPKSNLNINNYIGLEFELGKQDCFTLVRAYYKNEKGVDIQDYYRDAKELRYNKNIILDKVKEAGFVKLDRAELIKDDLLVFMFNDFPHHFGVYLGNNLFLQHMRSRKSNVEILTNSYKDKISYILRYNKE